MKIVRYLSAPISEAVVREQAITFLTQAGYRQQPDSDGYLHFKRGSNIGVFFNFNPQQWACEVFVRITSDGNSSKINMEAKISSDPTEKRFAEELITAEFTILEAAITLNQFKIYDINALKKKIVSHVYRTVGIFAFFMFSLILGIVGGLYVYIKLNISIFGASAIGFGILLLLVIISLMLWRKQKKTSL